MRINNNKTNSSKDKNFTLRANRTREGFLEFARSSRKKNKEFLDAWGNE